MSLLSNLEQVFGSPLVGFGMAALGVYLSYYFYIKQARAQGNMEAIISRLQEENSKLRELLNTDDEPLSDPSRERIMINLRALLQREDRKISAWRIYLPAFGISSTVWIAGLVLAIWDENGAMIFLAVLGGGLANLLVGAILADHFENSDLRKKATRIRTAFMAGKLNLREIDQLSKWVSGRRWNYISQDWILEVFQIWGSQTAEEWAAKPKEKAEPKPRRIIEERNAAEAKSEALDSESVVEKQINPG